MTSSNANPIYQHYKMGRQIGSSGVEMMWKIYDAVRLVDKKECSLFVFEKKLAEKLHKPRRCENVSQVIRREARYLECFEHAKILQLWHPIEESSESLAFASEPVLGSLANFLGNYERMLEPPSTAMQESRCCKVDLEVKLGIYQLNEGLRYLHSTQHVMHGNLNPSSIIITRSGCWKISGLGFVEKTNNNENAQHFTAWSHKVSKMAQPDIDYLAPELQLQGQASQACDIFAFGLLICAIFNQGNSLLKCNKSIPTYVKRVEELEDNYSRIASCLPQDLVEPVGKMISRNAFQRPTAQLFGLLKYFADDALLFLEGLLNCDQMLPAQVTHFFSSTPLCAEHFPSDMLFERIFPLLLEQMRRKVNLVACMLPSALCILEYCSEKDFRDGVFQNFVHLLRLAKNSQEIVILLDRFPSIAHKLTNKEIRMEVVPFIFLALESNSVEQQSAALGCISALHNVLNEESVTRRIFLKAKDIYQSSSNSKIKTNVLKCFSGILDTFDVIMILEELLPFIIDIRFNSPQIYMAVVDIYKNMLSQEKQSLTHDIIATKVLPSLIPFIVNPRLQAEEFDCTMDLLYSMMERICKKRGTETKSDIVSPPLSSSINGTSVSRLPQIKIPNSTGDAEDISATKNFNFKNCIASMTQQDSFQQPSRYNLEICNDALNVSFSNSQNDPGCTTSRADIQASIRRSSPHCLERTSALLRRISPPNIKQITAASQPARRCRQLPTIPTSSDRPKLSTLSQMSSFDVVNSRPTARIQHRFTLQDIRMSESVDRNSLALPTSCSRRHSDGNANSTLGDGEIEPEKCTWPIEKTKCVRITDGISEGPFIRRNSRTDLLTGSRRSSAQTTTNPSVVVKTEEEVSPTSATRRSSFNALSTSLINFFSLKAHNSANTNAHQ